MTDLQKYPNRWKPGESGNRLGRPVGSRNAFSQALIADVAASWAEHGPKTLEYVAKADPVRYLGVAVSLVPKDVAVSIQAQLPGQLSPEDWLRDRIRTTCAEAKSYVEQEAQRVKNSDEGRTLPLTWLIQNIYAVHRAHGCHCRAALALIDQDKKNG
jgi:hypothetical protein